MSKKVSRRRVFVAINFVPHSISEEIRMEIQRISAAIDEMMALIRKQEDMAKCSMVRGVKMARAVYDASAPRNKKGAEKESLLVPVGYSKSFIGNQIAESTIQLMGNKPLSKDRRRIGIALVELVQQQRSVKGVSHRQLMSFPRIPINAIG